MTTSRLPSSESPVDVLRRGIAGQLASSEAAAWAAAVRLFTSSLSKIDRRCACTVLGPSGHVRPHANLRRVAS